MRAPDTATGSLQAFVLSSVTQVELILALLRRGPPAEVMVSAAQEPTGNWRDLGTLGALYAVKPVDRSGLSKREPCCQSRSPDKKAEGNR